MTATAYADIEVDDRGIPYLAATRTKVLNSPARIRANPLRGKKRTNHEGTDDTERKFSRNLHTNGLLRVLRITKVYYLVFLTRFFEGASRPGSV